MFKILSGIKKARDTFIACWLLCVFWFLTLLLYATDGFSKTVQQTNFFNHGINVLLILGLTVLGVCSFLIFITLTVGLYFLNKDVKYKFKSNILYRFFLLLLIYGICAVVYNIVTYHYTDKNLLTLKSTSILSESQSLTEDELIALTNQEREKTGLKPLVQNKLLDIAAASKAEDMISKNYWSHFSPAGVGPWTFIKNANYPYIYAGENLARGFTTSSSVIDSWMGSKEHRENMLSPNYTEVGFAIKNGSLTGEETTLVIQMFGSREIQGSGKINSNTVISVPSVETVTSYRNDLLNVKKSWVDNYNQYSKTDSDKLIDSLTRQIEFCNTIINMLNTKKGSAKDINSLWNAVINMSNESATLSHKLSGN
jgi:uncharacterized protein YkwD